MKTFLIVACSVSLTLFALALLEEFQTTKKTGQAIGVYAETSVSGIPAFEQEEERFCDVCGKSLTFVDGTTRTSIIGMELSLSDSQKDKKYSEFLKEQMGPYEVGKTYRECWGCWLKSLGMKNKDERITLHEDHDGSHV